MSLPTNREPRVGDQPQQRTTYRERGRDAVGRRIIEWVWEVRSEFAGGKMWSTGGWALCRKKEEAELRMVAKLEEAKCRWKVSR